MNSDLTVDIPTMRVQDYVNGDIYSVLSVMAQSRPQMNAKYHFYTQWVCVLNCCKIWQGPHAYNTILHTILAAHTE